MSQVSIINIAGGGGGGSPILTVTGDDGTPITPTANNINLIGGTSTVNNNKGITVLGTLGTSTETFTLTNRLQALLTTIDATPTNIIAFTLPAAGTYTFNFVLSNFNVTDSLGASYNDIVGFRSTGAAAFKVATDYKLVMEEVGNTGCDVTTSASVNTVQLICTGLAGKTINWNVVGYYVYVGP